MAFRAKVRLDDRMLRRFVNDVNLRMLNFHVQAGVMIRDETKDLASRRAGGGRLYTFTTTRRRKGRSKTVQITYRASAPGEPPVKRTGIYWRSINYNVEAGPAGIRLRTFTTNIGTDLLLGRWLEFGTSKMKPRPHFRPAYFKRRGDVRRLFHSVVMLGQ